MKEKTIVVINPNSDSAVTDALDRALIAFRLDGGPSIECLTLREGPLGIEAQIHADQVVLPMARLIESRPDASAFVIACYADPGIDALREIAEAPVFGSQESGILTALARGDLVGVIAASDSSIRRHRRYLRRLALSDRVYSERPMNMSVGEIARDERCFERLVEVGRNLIADEVDAIVLGCAGMARHRAALENALQVPVIEPTQAAVAMALGALQSQP